MPVAVISGEAERFDLSTAPPDGFIMARPLPYGMKLERRDQAMLMRMEQEVQERGKGKRRTRSDNGDPQTQKIDLELRSNWAAKHDFGYCIVDHNLTDDNGTKLDFTNPMTFQYLDPRIGSEIERILSDLNDDDEDGEGFTPPALRSSEAEAKV
jgi:hypothetical protein